MRPENVQEKGFRVVLLALACGLLAACAATPPVDTPAVPDLEKLPNFEIESVDPLEMSTEMEQFVEAHLAGRPAEWDRAWTIAHALLDPVVFEFHYDPQVTLTAREAFRTRRGNCLTFSNMFIAMARHAGLSARYREVQIEPEWSSLEETLLVSLHVNASTSDRGKDYVVDVSRRFERPGEVFRHISDAEAEAQFYNNLGANALIGGDLAMAYAYFRKAEQTLPGLPYVWSNLGVVLRRNGQTDDAILAYDTARALDENHSVSLNNLYTIYEEEGNLEAAEAIQATVERNRRKNPYYMHYLAQMAFAEQLWDQAFDYARRAIRLDDEEYRFYYTLAQLHYQTGNEWRAENNLAKAIQRVPEWVDSSSLVLPGEIPTLPEEDSPD